MSAYPRLNRGALRSTVRELTAIYSTDIISDARINDLLNQRLYQITQTADNFGLFYRNLLLNGPILVPTSATTKVHRFPGWKWDNTTDYPTTVAADLYLESDSDVPPWSDGSNDIGLAYAAAADVLSMVNDDSRRVADYSAKFKELADRVIRDDFVNWNAFLADTGLTDTTIAGYQEASHLMYALRLVQNAFSIDSQIDVAGVLWYEIIDERNAFYSAFKWPPSITNTFNSFGPYSVIFAYGAAAKYAQRMGMSADLVNSLNSSYNMYKDALLRQLIYNTSGLAAVGTVGNVASQLRALLQDFTSELPEALIYSWINIAYQTLVQEREWEWLVNTADITFPATLNSVNLLPILGTYQRILNVYEVRYDGNFEVIDSEIVYPVPHILDGKVGDSKYKYDINEGSFSVTPTPTETTYFRIRYAQETAPFTPALPNVSLGFSVNLADIITYRAAVIGSSWSDYAKKMAPVFQDVADKLFDAMVSTYQLDHSTEPLQLGGSALEGKKYMPWFRPA
jgi:hypothetical protein